MSGGAGLLVERETVLGQVVLQEHVPAGAVDPFAPRVFDLEEVAETLVLGTQLRVYEELVIRVQQGRREEVVSAVLRREHADITVTGRVSGAGNREADGAGPPAHEAAC